MSTDQFVQVVVGGLPYSIAVSDIEKFSGSFFECMIKKEWMTDESKPIVIERDGALFKYVYSFLVNDHLPRDERGLIALNEDVLERLKVEADFYGLESLSKECEIHQKKPLSELEGFITIRKYIDHVTEYSNDTDNDMNIEFSSALVQSLKCVWAPFCLIGDMYIFRPEKIFQNSTFNDLKLDELIAGATQSPFGRGMETVIDTTVRNSFEIPASELNVNALRQISKMVHLTHFAPHLKLELRPYKLVIYREGGHFDAHRDTVRGENHIGTLVTILNSKYTGGELEVSHGGRTETVTGDRKWVAMYGDCLHKINPVTSGTRVSLIYDIYGTARDLHETYVASDEEMTEEENFWRAQEDSRTAVSADKRRGLDEAQRGAIMTALSMELSTHDALIITLQHLYPECQSSPAFLKGGDRALYDLLSEQYDVQVVATTIYRVHDPEDTSYDSTTCSLFSLVPSDASEEASSKKPRVKPSRTKLVIPLQFDKAGLLDYTPYIEHTGNESQAEKTVYIVAGLQVTKRA